MHKRTRGTSHSTAIKLVKHGLGNFGASPHNTWLATGGRRSQYHGHRGTGVPKNTVRSDQVRQHLVMPVPPTLLRGASVRRHLTAAFAVAAFTVAARALLSVTAVCRG